MSGFWHVVHLVLGLRNCLEKPVNVELQVRVCVRVCVCVCVCVCVSHTWL